MQDKISKEEIKMNFWLLHKKPPKIRYFKRLLAFNSMFALQLMEHGKLTTAEIGLAESAISKSAEHSYTYARDVIEGRFELGEAAIKNSPRFSFDYASDVLDGRFKLGERAISRSAVTAYYYAFYILKGEFPSGKKGIMKSKYKHKYLKLIKKLK